MRAPLLGLIFTAAAWQQAAADLILSFPVDCTLGETCFLQQYVDRDPGPGAQDFTCAALSYDGHSGTDIRVPDFAALSDNIAILAAADGGVRGVRDGMEDGPLTEARRAALNGRDCGNGVVIDHGGGWETQYCHLRQGSVRVRSGERVSAGTPLGFMGQSGRAEFPHLHLTVRKDGTVVDPFAPSSEPVCSANQPTTLWVSDIPYQAGGLLSAGFLDAVPDFSDIRAGTAEASELPVTGTALVLWGYAFGTQSGDQLRLTITAPDGSVFHENRLTFERTQAEAFRASGRRLRASAWPSGTYTGTVALERGGQVIDQQTRTVTLN